MRLCAKHNMAQMKELYCGRRVSQGTATGQRASFHLDLGSPRFVLSLPRDVLPGSSSLQPIKRECHQRGPGHGINGSGVGNESCDGRGGPPQLLSPSVYSDCSLHPGSCRGPEGGPVSWSRHGPGTLLNHGEPIGAAAWRGWGRQRAPRHGCHSLNQRGPLQNFLAFKRGVAVAASKRNSQSRGGYQLLLSFFSTTWRFADFYFLKQCYFKLNILLLARLHAKNCRICSKTREVADSKEARRKRTSFSVPNSSICYWILQCLAGRPSVGKKVDCPGQLSMRQNLIDFSEEIIVARRSRHFMKRLSD